MLTRSHAVLLLVLLHTPAWADSNIYLRSPFLDDPSLESRQNRPEYFAHPAHELLCRPFGECEPCPKDEVRDIVHALAGWNEGRID
jgi:hypothetical protein